MHELNDFNKIQNCPIPAANRADTGALYQSLGVLQFVLFYLSLIDQYLYCKELDLFNVSMD